MFPFRPCNHFGANTPSILVGINFALLQTQSVYCMTTARFTFGLAVVAVLIMLGPVKAMCRTRKLLTGDLH